MMKRYHGQRGQTLPFWAFSILMSFSLVFFVYNYSNTLRYQIHAQNAADSAATAALAGDAARLNSVQTLLFALNVQEFQTREIVNAVPDLLTGGDSNCSTATSILNTQCLSDLSAAATALQDQVTNLTNVTTALNTFSGQLTGNNIANVPSTVSSFYSNNCVNLSTDCSFKYTTAISLVNGLPYVDEYACEQVPTFQYGYFLPGAPKTYYAVGHTAYALAPLNQQLDSANGFGGLTESVLANNANLFPNISGTSIIGSFAGLNIGTGYYAPVPVKSTAAPVSVKNITC
jgi:hypothetical protein